MKLNELLKVIYKLQNIEVYKDENLLKRKIRNVFTLECEVDEDNESYIIITLF